MADGDMSAWLHGSRIAAAEGPGTAAQNRKAKHKQG